MSNKVSESLKSYLDVFHHNQQYIRLSDELPVVPVSYISMLINEIESVENTNRLLSHLELFAIEILCKQLYGKSAFFEDQFLQDKISRLVLLVDTGQFNTDEAKELLVELENILGKNNQILLKLERSKIRQEVINKHFNQNYATE